MKSQVKCKICGKETNERLVDLSDNGQFPEDYFHDRCLNEELERQDP